MPYTFAMTILFFHNVCAVLAPALQGFFWLAFLFAVSFFGVHIAKFTLLGWKQRKNTPEKPPEKPREPPKEKAPPQPAPEPVYYIVEKKRRRTKPSYGEPKEIRFK